jgi:uncharacterized lipoprotein YajG
MRIAGLACALALVSGCAFTAQRVNLAPQVRVSGSGIGEGRTVFVRSVDERTSNVLGVRGGQGIGAEITADDVEGVVNRSLIDGLRQIGFQPTLQRVGGAPELRVEIRTVEYKITTGFWAGGLDANVALKAICIVGEARPYERLHRGHHEETILVVQSASQNELYINSALSRAIESVLADRELMTCLKR